MTGLNKSMTRKAYDSLLVSFKNMLCLWKSLCKLHKILKLEVRYHPGILFLYLHREHSKSLDHQDRDKEIEGTERGICVFWRTGNIGT